MEPCVEGHRIHKTQRITIFGLESWLHKSHRDSCLIKFKDRPTSAACRWKLRGCGWIVVANVDIIDRHTQTSTPSKFHNIVICETWPSREIVYLFPDSLTTRNCNEDFTSAVDCPTILNILFIFQPIKVHCRRISGGNADFKIIQVSQVLNLNCKTSGAAVTGER